MRRRDFAAGSAATFATIGYVRAPVKAAQYEFKCGSSLPVEHPSIVRTKQMWAAVERESGGRIRTEVFPFNVLGGDAAMLSQLRLGAIQFLAIGQGPLQPLVPSVDILNVAFAFRDETEALHTVDGALGTVLGKEISSKGLYMLRTMWGSGMRQMTSSSHPIRSAEDLNGFKVRVAASKIIVDFYRTLGASPVPLSNSEMYTALQTKLVDGNDLSLLTIAQTRMNEVQKYLSLTNHIWTGLWLIANGDMWNGLPPDLQAIVERNNHTHALLERRDTKLQSASITDKLGRLGFAINRVDPAAFRPRLSSYYATWSSTFGTTAWGALESSLGHKLG